MLLQEWINNKNRHSSYNYNRHLQSFLRQLNIWVCFRSLRHKYYIS